MQPEWRLVQHLGDQRGTDDDKASEQDDEHRRPIARVGEFFRSLALPAPLDEATDLLLTEIRARLRYLEEVGLGYLTLDRQSRTLSGGEVQRINLTTALGTSLVNTLFVLDGKKVGSSDAVKEWTVEGPSPRQLETKGWGRAVSKAGDTVTFEGRPRRDGQPELLLLSVTLADGSTVLGFLCEAYATAGATDITSFGGWRGYLKSLG